MSLPEAKREKLSARKSASKGKIICFSLLIGKKRADNFLGERARETSIVNCEPIRRGAAAR
jgi:hypothetical protein